MGILDRLGLGRRTERAASLTELQALADRGATAAGSVRVTQDTALRHSAVWAALRLRANLISTMPLDVYRVVNGVQVQLPTPLFLDTPSGPDSHMHDWLWATQFDLDRYGLTAGIITERDGGGLVRRIDLVSAADVTLRGSGWDVTEVQVGREKYTPEQVYLEYQYRPAGFLVPLCPIAYAAWSIGGYLSAQQFGLDYFGNGAFPSGVLRNAEKQVNDPVAVAEIKARFKAATSNRDVFVTGRDWEWTAADAPKAAEAFLEEKRAGVVEVARFLDTPADMIDGAVSGQSVTYANMSQRNVQLLVTSLGPAITRRERRLSRLLARPRFVKLNTDAILRMDPETRAKVLNEGIAARRIAPSEARALDNREPFTEEQYAEFDRLWGDPNRKPVTSGGSTTGGTV
jgi:HK97 family phage portal protein